MKKIPGRNKGGTTITAVGEYPPDIKSEIYQSDSLPHKISLLHPFTQII